MFNNKKTRSELFSFINDIQLKDKLDSLANFDIISVVPVKYRVASMGETRVLETVIIIYKD